MIKISKVLFINAFFLLFCSVLYGQVDLQNELQLYIPFRSNAQDFSKNNHKTTVYGASSGLGISQNGNDAYYFDGVDDHLIVKNSSTLDFDPGESFAISLWFKADSTSTGIESGDILSKWNSTHVDTSYSYGIRFNTNYSDEVGKVSIVRYDGDDDGCKNSVTHISSEPIYLDNKWHHLVLQLDADNNLQLFIDNELIGSIEDKSICSLRSNSDIILGTRTSKNPKARPFKGGIDEFRVYSRSLSMNEIEILSKANDGLEIYLPFNGNALDESGFSHKTSISGAQLGVDITQNQDRAYYFDGIDDYISIKNSPSLDFNVKEAFAISLCFKADSTETNIESGDILSKWNSTHVDTSYSYGIRFNTNYSDEVGKVSIVRYDGDDDGCKNSVTHISSEPIYLDNKWHHLVLQLDADNNLQLFIDNELIGSIEDKSICNLRSNSDIILGTRTSKNPKARPFKGGIDEFRIYSRSLEPEEIERLGQKTVTSKAKSISNVGVKIFPNPTNSSIAIKMIGNHRITKGQVYDITGRSVGFIKNMQFDFLNKKGLFLLVVDFENGSRGVHRIVVQ